MMMDNYKDKLYTLINEVEKGTPIDWEYLTSKLDMNVHPDSLRKAFFTTPFSGYNVAKYFIDNINSHDNNDEIVRLEKLRFEIEKERKKKQSINHEYHKAARIEARNELFYELLAEQIQHLSPITIKDYQVSKKSHRTAMLCISDAHYGKSFQLTGLYNEVINSYNREEFKERMWHLLAQFTSDNTDYEQIIVCDLGDCIDGILRMSSLQKLDSSVIDAIIEYGEFISIWLSELYKRTKVPIKYCLTGGNHDVIRFLTDKKTFDDENIAKVIHKYIEVRSQNLNNYINITPYNDALYQTIYGIGILTYHGDTKNLKEDLLFFENFYDCTIDIIISGHLHRNSSESIGYGIVGDKEVIRVPSIMGTDEYAKSIRRCSRAGCKLIVFNEQGKELEKIYYLN